MNTQPTQKDILMFLLKYELQSSWWAGWISNAYLQELAARYFSLKVSRKYRRAFK